MAHNFNNLVGAIAGQAEMTLDLLPPTHRAAGHVARLLQTSSRAQAVASQILDFGRTGGGVKRPVAIPPILDETIAYVASAAETADVTIHLERSGQDACVFADPGRLQQVFHNIVLNAVQASPRSSRVRILVDEARLDRPASQGNRPAGGYVRIMVIDQGSGMEPSPKARAFEPFFTTKQSGTGLGLATAQETLRELEGSIEVESA